MPLTTKLDIKQIARTLYNNRANPDYQSKTGQRKILGEQGIKMAKATYDAHYDEVRAEIDKLHDAAFRKETRPAERERMAELFSQMDYITGLKRIWDGEPDTQGKYPTFRDILQAGKQAAEFFGWNAPAKVENTHEASASLLEWMRTGRLKAFNEDGDQNKDFKEIL